VEEPGDHPRPYFDNLPWPWSRSQVKFLFAGATSQALHPSTDQDQSPWTPPRELMDSPHPPATVLPARNLFGATEDLSHGQEARFLRRTGSTRNHPVDILASPPATPA